MKDVAVVAYCRTGIAKAQRGALNQTHGIPMTAHVLRHAVTARRHRRRRGRGRRRRVRPARGRDRATTSRATPRSRPASARRVPGMTVNRYCGSGLSAASIVANRIAAGEATIADRRRASRASAWSSSTCNLNGFFYEPLQQRMPAVWWTMNQTADFVAKKYGITPRGAGRVRRAEPAASRRRDRGRQVRRGDCPVHDQDEGHRQGDQGATHEQEVTLDRDEGPRPDTTLAGLAALKPVYPGGTTTAGNASQLSDGAGAVVMMDADVAARRGLPILGLFRGMQLAAVAPEEMSIAIAPAIRKLMKHHGLAMADVDLWELHEAYAVTTLYNQAQLETPVGDHERQRRRGPARPPLRHVRHPLPRLHAARARAPRAAPRGRRRVHGGRHGHRGVPRTRLSERSPSRITSSGE